ncbi:hypothetical protein HLB03_03060, partial [Acidianus sp. DSM 29099]|nr:hypothetical protein [Acidianus sp. RZ1]
MGHKTAVRYGIAIALMTISIFTYKLSFDMSYLLLFSLLSSVSFWTSVALLVPFRFYKSVYSEIKKTRAYWISAGLYLTFHILIYGFFYYFLLGYFVFQPLLTAYVGASVPTPIYLLPYWESYSPGIAIFIA